MSSLRELIKSMKVPAPPRSKQRGRVPGLMAERMNRWLADRPDLTVEELIPHAKFLADQVQFHFLRQFSTSGKQHWRIRPSGQKCTRDEGFKKLGYGEMPSELVGTFFAGDFCEAYGITIGLLSGCKLSSFQDRVSIPVGKDTIYGSIDCLLKIGTKLYLVDFKSASPYSFKNAGVGEDVWGYYRQLKTYMMSNELKGRVAGGLLVYLNKGNWREFKEVPVPVPTDDDIIQWEEHCLSLANCKDTNSLPAKPEWAVSRRSTLRKPETKTVEVLDDIRCQLCQNVQHCWGKEWYLRPGGKDNEYIRDL